MMFPEPSVLSKDEVIWVMARPVVVPEVSENVLPVKSPVLEMENSEVVESPTVDEAMENKVRLVDDALAEIDNGAKGEDVPIPTFPAAVKVRVDEDVMLVPL